MPSSSNNDYVGDGQLEVRLPADEAAVMLPAERAETVMAPDDLSPVVEDAAAPPESGSAELDSPASDVPAGGLSAIQERRALLMRRIESDAAKAREAERRAALEREKEFDALRERLNESQAQLASLREMLTQLESEKELAASERRREAGELDAERQAALEARSEYGRLQEEYAGMQADVEGLRKQVEDIRHQLEESREELRTGKEMENRLREQLGEAVRELEAKQPLHSLPTEPRISKPGPLRLNISGKKIAIVCALAVLFLAGAAVCWTYLQAAPQPVDLIDPRRVPDANATLSGAGEVNLLPEKKADEALPAVPAPPARDLPASAVTVPAGRPQAASPVPAALTNSTVVQQAAQGNSSASSAQASADSVPPPPRARTGGNVDKLTRLRADLTEYELLARLKDFELKIHEQDAKLRQMDTPPIIPPAPPAPVAPAVVPPSAPVRVASVQGIDGRMTARVRLSSGKMVFLRAGEKFSGGVVAGIDRDGVRIRRAGRITTIPFE